MMLSLNIHISENRFQLKKIKLRFNFIRKMKLAIKFETKLLKTFAICKEILYSQTYQRKLCIFRRASENISFQLCSYAELMKILYFLLITKLNNSISKSIN